MIFLCSQKKYFLSIRCTSFSESSFEMELVCLNESETFLTDLMTEVGWRLKTNIALSQIRWDRFEAYIFCVV